MAGNKEKAPMSHIKKSTASKVFDACNALFMIAFCITILFPLWDVIVRSLSRPQDISYMSLNLFPKNFTVDAYQYCLENEGLVQAVIVSVARTALGTVLHLIVVALCGYALTKQELPFRNLIQTYFLIPMFVSAGTIPIYINIKNLGLTDSFWVYVLPTSFSIFNCIIVRNYFYSIDKSMEESASIDGASYFTIFKDIILPLSKPVLATVALWQMVGQWNAWFDNMMYNQGNKKLLTLQYMLRRMLDRLNTSGSSGVSGVDAMGVTVDASEDTVKAAITVIVVLPIVCVYPFVQKYFVKGIMVGAVKG